MVDINELYITPDNKRMIIDASVRDDEYHKDAYISEIVFDTQDTFVPEIGVPSSEWIAKRPVDMEDGVAKIAWETKMVDEYYDLVCPCRHEIIHREHGHCCGRHQHKDVCKDRTGGTGHYSNPYIVKEIDEANGTAIDKDGNVITLSKGDYVKVDKDGFKRVDFLNDAEYSSSTRTLTITGVNTDNDDEDSPESENMYVYDGEKLEKAPDVTNPHNRKHIKVEVKQEDLCRPFEDTMFFVWIKCDGVKPDAPCSLNKEYTLGICINHFNVYRRFICLMRELLKDCDIPKDFIDLWLRWKAVKMAIETGNYLEAVLLWKRFFLFHHQRPLWESPQYTRFWGDWHKDGILPYANYHHPSYGFGGSFFNFTGGHCRTCAR